MLERVITNPIETPRGYKNPHHGIALRGPLSQFFSAIYLKKLDDAFLSAEVTYIRYQDDVLILCKSKTQMNRCRRRMMEILQERGLSLSRRKTRIGSIQENFHFLGVQYEGTQPHRYITVSHSAHDAIIEPDNPAAILAIQGGRPLDDQQSAPHRIVPHARTLRKARVQVQLMIADQFSTAFIKNYLHRWTKWWSITVDSWQYHILLQQFLDKCWDHNTAAYARSLLQHRVREGCTRSQSASRETRDCKAA